MSMGMCLGKIIASGGAHVQCVSQRLAARSETPGRIYAYRVDLSSGIPNFL
jgi:hypothetical protein